jgi:hypothetical protein
MHGTLMQGTVALTPTLFAQAAGTVTEKFEFGRIGQMTPLLWLALAVAAVVVIAAVIYFYLRDCVELGGLIATVLISLRLAAFLGLLWIFLLPQQRIERPVTINSRVLMLFDTSLSMTVTDEGTQRRRIDEVSGQLESSNLIRELRKKHDIVAMRFDSSEENLATLVKIPEPAGVMQAVAKKPENGNFYEKYWPALAIAGVVLVAIIAVWLTTSLSLRLRTMISIPVLLLGLVILAVWSANFTDLWSRTRADSVASRAGGDSQPKKQEETATNWKQLLEIRPGGGQETRIVEMLNRVVDAHLTQPAIAGIVLVTDGCNTDGIDPSGVLKKAKGRNIPIYTVGIGSDKMLAQVRVTDFNVPAKAYPGDSYSVTALVQGTGLGDQLLDVDLLLQDADSKDDQPKQVEKTQVTLDPNGEKVSVPFQLKADKTGRFRLTVRVHPPGGITNAEEQTKSEVVEVVNVKTQVLLFASGPTREYRFLRNQLRRDPSMVVDVLLQTITKLDGVAQDANEILLEFPKDKQALRKYHSIVCFDPEWQKLTPEQIDLLENWVAKDAGGLVLVPGPIHTYEWVIRAQNDEGLKKIRTLFPVVFPSEIRDSVDRGTREARKIEWFDPRAANNDNKTAPKFLWLTDDESTSHRAWGEFEGFFDCYESAGSKEGAHVYAVLPDKNGQKLGAPVVMADQFYGSGRVFYLGSGELWRIRSVNESFYETVWTKIVRYVSQGTLLRGTKRGMLLTEDEYDVGQTVFARVQMEDAQGNELTAASLGMEFISPDEQLHTLELKGNAKKPGYFTGQFPVTRKGTYKVRVPIPDSDEALTKDIKVRLPDRENRNTRLNKPFLARISGETGAGAPLLGMAEAVNVAAPTALVNRLKDRTEVQPVEDTPKYLWDNHYTLWLIVALLCMEWLIRRLCKLA